MFLLCQGEDPFTNEAVDPEIEGDDNLGGEDKEETPEEVAAEVLAEVITATVRAVEGEVPAPESSEMLAEGKGPVDMAEATSGPHPEQLLEAETPCGMASEKGNAEAETGGEAAQAGGKAAEAGSEAAHTGGEAAQAGGATEAESTITVTAPTPAATEAEVKQNEAESKDVIPTE